MDNLIIPISIRNKILACAEQQSPKEACGLLSGTGNRIRHHFPITNTMHSLNRFLMDGKEMLTAFDWIEEHGQTLLAIYHSHPNGPSKPSQTDLNADHYSDAVKIIVSNTTSKWELKGFIMNDEKYDEIPLLTTQGIDHRQLNNKSGV